MAVAPETVHRSGVSERNDTTRFSRASASVEASNLTGAAQTYNINAIDPTHLGINIEAGSNTVVAARRAMKTLVAVPVTPAQ